MAVINKFFAKGRVTSLQKIAKGYSFTVASPVFVTRRRDSEIKTVAVETYPNFYVTSGSEAEKYLLDEKIKVGDSIEVEGQFRSYIDSRHQEAVTDIEATIIKRDISRLDSAYFVPGREYSTPENSGYVSGKITEIHLTSSDSNNKPAVIQIDISEKDRKNVVRALCYGAIKSKILKEAHVGDEIKTYGIVQTPDKKANKDKKVIFYHNYTIYDYALTDKKDNTKAS